MDLSKRREEIINRLKLIEQEYFMTIGKLKEIEEQMKLASEKEKGKEDK
tara:strand:+ start:3336 stop:3482 length:147 start_codon:yes stop_codon:yes gene_type:complete